MSNDEYPGKSGRLLLRMPINLHECLVQRAGAEEVSLNQYICGVLAGAVSWERSEKFEEYAARVRHDIAWEMWDDRTRRRTRS